MSHLEIHRARAYVAGLDLNPVVVGHSNNGGSRATEQCLPLTGVWFGVRVPLCIRAASRENVLSRSESWHTSSTWRHKHLGKKTVTSGTLGLGQAPSAAADPWPVPVTEAVKRRADPSIRT